MNDILNERGHLDRGITRRAVLRGSVLVAGAATSGLLPGMAFGQGTRDTDTVRLGWGKTGLTMIARQRGELEKTLAGQGIKVEWVGPFPNHAPSLQAVVGGSADFGFWGSSTPALAAIIAGSPLVFTAFSLNSPRSTAIIVKDDSGIASVKDLVGKSVAVNRSGLGEFLLVAALEQNGVSRDDVKFVYLNPPDAGPAFGQGKVDAWSMWSPGVDIARDQFKGRDVFVEGLDMTFPIDFESFVTTREFATDNSALARAALDAFQAEAKWSNANPSEAELMAQEAGGYSDAVREAIEARGRRFTFYEPSDAAFADRFQFAADWLAEREVLPKQIDVREYLVQV
jgi:sulfonate transport system substrate-binding protein